MCCGGACASGVNWSFPAQQESELNYIFVHRLKLGASAGGSIPPRPTPERKIMIFKAKKISGLNCAHYTIPVSSISNCYPSIVNFFQGTINLSLETPIFFKNPPITTPPLFWAQNAPHQRFDVIPIEVKKDGESDFYEAIIIRPHFSPHLKNPYYLEIMTKRILISDNDIMHFRFSCDFSEIKAIEI